jgi:hypothetical protein
MGYSQQMNTRNGVGSGDGKCTDHIRHCFFLMKIKVVGK